MDETCKLAKLSFCLSGVFRPLCGFWEDRFLFVNETYGGGELHYLWRRRRPMSRTLPRNTATREGGLS